MLERSVASHIKTDLNEKMVLLMGPRQVGKTTLARAIYPDSTEYLNYDRLDDLKIITGTAWKRDCDLLVLDEIHKMKKWKSWIKGVYDTEGIKPGIIVTGSARLDTYKKGGDSLAGRHYYYRLDPFSVAELKKHMSPDEALESLLKFGGFPEPLLKGSETAAKRWRNTNIERIIRDDLQDLEKIHDLRSIAALVHLLRERVGLAVSYQSLAEDLQVAPNTVKKWIGVLEALLVVFVVRPYSKNIAKAILKEPKIYFYDTGSVIGDEAARLENTMAVSLLKRLHFITDTTGDETGIFYVRDKLKRESDFLTVRDGRPEYLVEVKLSDGNPAKQLEYFGRFLKPKGIFQIVKNLQRDVDSGGIKIRKASRWLASLEA